MAEGAENSKRSYELKVLKQIYNSVFDEKSFKRDCRVWGAEFGMDTFNDEGPIPITFFTPETKITVQPVHVLRSSGFTKTELYKAYSAVVSRIQDKLTMFNMSAAMFFPIKGMSNFVIHNAEHLSTAFGTNVVTREAKNHTVIRIEPLYSFIHGLELAYKNVG